MMSPHLPKRNPKLDPAELAAWTTVTSTILKHG
jgi:hypothetical protein